MKKQKKTITPLEQLRTKSQNAINVVLSTIENLRNTNKMIDEEYQKNNEIIDNISHTNNSLKELKSSNEKIIGNFEKLIN